MLNKLFSIDTKSSNRIILQFLGIKIKILKPSVKDEAKKFVKLDCPVSEIPKATGTLRKIQLANLKMLQIFDKICNDNGFEYWLDYGNLLGAVRHKGFIPWDDDIDLGMERDDYERFLEKFKDGFTEYEDLYIFYNNNGKNKCFIKIKHKKLPNIAIDIFPYDYYYKKMTLDEKIEVTKRIHKFSDNKLNILGYPYYINHPEAMRERIKKERIKLLDGHAVDKSVEPPLYYGMDAPHVYKNFFFDFDVIYPLKKIKFENIEFSCPNNIDSILTQVYGNYMELPDDCYPRHANSGNFENEEFLNEFIADIKYVDEV